MDRYDRFRTLFTTMLAASAAAFAAREVSTIKSLLQQPAYEPFIAATNDFMYFLLTEFRPDMEDPAIREKNQKSWQTSFKDADFADLEVVRNFDPDILAVTVMRCSISTYRLPFDTTRMEFFDVFGVTLKPVISLAYDNPQNMVESRAVVELLVRSRTQDEFLSAFKSLREAIF